MAEIRDERDVLPVLQEGGKQAPAHLPACSLLLLFLLVRRSCAAVSLSRPACLSEGEDEGEKRENKDGGEEERQRRRIKRKREGQRGGWRSVAC